MIRAFNPQGMVQPASRYSQGVEVSGNARWLHISGQIGVAPDGTVAKGLEGQFTQAFENIGMVLAAAGMAKTDLVKVTVFVTVPGPETVAIYRKARDQWMEGHAPAATYLVVAGLAHADYLVEIEAIAAG
jgi:enamine deaminase RidA (YjgF/YER057c/UK114 family)